MWLFRFRNYVRFERGLYLRCRQPLYRYAPYAGLDVVPVAVPIARPCAVGDVPDSSRHAPLRDDSHDSRLHGSVSRRRMSDWSRCQWNLPDGYPAYAGYPRRRTEIRMFGRTMDPVFAGCGQRLGWAWACNHREPPRAFGDRRAAAWFMAPTVDPSARGALPCLADGWWRSPPHGEEYCFICR